jgi:hypothetical protein
MRVAWRTVGAIARRVVPDARAVTDPLDDLTRIGVDEISYNYVGDPVNSTFSLLSLPAYP